MKLRYFLSTVCLLFAFSFSSYAIVDDVGDKFENVYDITVDLVDLSIELQTPVCDNFIFTKSVETLKVIKNIEAKNELSMFSVNETASYDETNRIQNSRSDLSKETYKPIGHPYNPVSLFENYRHTGHEYDC